MMRNLFSDLPDIVSVEQVDVLAENKSIRFKRIVSTGHGSLERFRYDQAEHQ